MNWFFIALGSALFYSVASIQQRHIMKQEKSNPLAFSMIFQFACALVVFVVALIKGFVLPPFLELWVNILLSGAFYGGATIALFTALQTTQASKVTIIGSASSIVTILIAVIFLGEKFTLYHGFGTALILVSVFLVNEKIGTLTLDKGAKWAFLAAILFGLGLANDAFILKYSDALSYLAIDFFLPGVFIALVNPTKAIKVHTFLKSSILKQLLVLSTTYSIAAIAFFTAMSIAPVSQVSPIGQSYIVITVLLSAIFLKERDHLLKKIIAAVLVFIGVLLLR